MNIKKIHKGHCGNPGPYATHCTLEPGHHYSCYDEGSDVSFNDRHTFRHDCSDPDCENQNFDNEGD